MSRRAWLGALAGCLVALVVIPTGWILTRPDASGVGQLPARADIARPTTTATGTGTADTSPASRGGVPEVPIYQADISAQRASTTRAPIPTRLTIQGLSSIPVDAVGVAGDGTVAIPHNAEHVGWYQFGPTPGDGAGSAVIVGHRDSRTQGRGALYDLGAVNVGDRIQVRLSDGTSLGYRIVERRLYVKQGLPWSTFFTDHGPPRLTVITCGGSYDAAHGGYQDNLIVTATPA
jgi:hypothetical protein